MDYMSIKMPKGIRLKGRTSSITNAKINGIIPCIQPTDEEIREALICLGQDPDGDGKVLCVYCGNEGTEWDHLNPLIINKKHSGYITEINNLVPACGTCNSSKGNKEWKDWLLNCKGPKTPRARGVPESAIQNTIAIIEKYQKKHKPHKIDLKKITGPEVWKEYEDSVDAIIKSIENAQTIADKFKEETHNAVTIYLEIEKLLRKAGEDFFMECHEIVYKNMNDTLKEIRAKISEDHDYSYTDESWNTKISATRKILKLERLEIAIEICQNS